MQLSLKFVALLSFFFVVSFVLAVEYNYLYENLSREVPFYEDKIIEVEATWNGTTESLNSAYNYTTTVKKYKTEYYDGERIGVVINGETINGWVNIQDKTLSQWSVPIGDRNFEEYGGCREYEIKKGVCSEVNVDEIK